MKTHSCVFSLTNSNASDYRGLGKSQVLFDATVSESIISVEIVAKSRKELIATELFLLEFCKLTMFKAQCCF